VSGASGGGGAKETSDAASGGVVSTFCSTGFSGSIGVSGSATTSIVSSVASGKLFQNAVGAAAIAIAWNAADPKRLHNKKVLIAFPSFVR
jgi:hypothetical protein